MASPLSPTFARALKYGEQWERTGWKSGLDRSHIDIHARTNTHNIRQGLYTPTATRVGADIKNPVPTVLHPLG